MSIFRQQCLKSALRATRTHRFTIAADIHVSFPLKPLPGPAHAIMQADVTFLFRSGEGGDAPEVSLLQATLIDCAGLEPDDAEVTRIARRWLDADGYELACQHAEARAT